MSHPAGYDVVGHPMTIFDEAEVRRRAADQRAEAERRAAAKQNCIAKIDAYIVKRAAGGPALNKSDKLKAAAFLKQMLVSGGGTADEIYSHTDSNLHDLSAEC